MTDTSFDSLPSPGYVPIRRRSNNSVSEEYPLSPSSQTRSNSQSKSCCGPVPESVFDINLDDLESDYDLHPKLSQTETSSHCPKRSSNSFDALRFSDENSITVYDDIERQEDDKSSQTGSEVIPCVSTDDTENILTTTEDPLLHDHSEYSHYIRASPTPSDYTHTDDPNPFGTVNGSTSDHTVSGPCTAWSLPDRTAPPTASTAPLTAPPSCHSSSLPALHSTPITHYAAWSLPDRTAPPTAPPTGYSSSLPSLPVLHSTPKTPNAAAPVLSHNSPNISSVKLRAVEGEEERVVSIHYTGGKLGAAVYNTETSRLDLLTDIPDLAPGYDMMKSLLHQVDPHYVLISARQDQSLLELLRSLAGSSNVEISSSILPQEEDGDDLVNRKFTLVVRPSMQFGTASCRRRMLGLQLPGYNSRAGSDQEQMVRLASYVDMGCESVVRAAGALLKYLDSSLPAAELDTSESGMGHVLFLGSLVLEEVLTVDEASATSLQIFSSTAQLSGSTAGSWNKRREGMSIFSLLNRCGSVVGSRYMRHLLRCPSAKMEVIQSRQRALAFLTAPSNVEVVAALATSLKLIKNFHRIIKKMANSAASIMDWYGFHRTLVGLTQLAELESHCKGEVIVLSEVKAVVLDTVYNLLGLIDQVIDFPASKECGSFCIKPGVDKELDDKKLQHAGLPDLLSAVAEEEAKNLPPGVKACTVCYIPHVGFLIAMPYKKTSEKTGDSDQNIPNFEFIFESNGAKHYRNSRTRALDSKLGDVMLDITRVEMRVMSQLTEMVLDSRQCMEKVVALCGQLDCLLALAIVSRENNWSRPCMVEAGAGIVIEDGRHPLQELTTVHFISNDTYLGGDNCPVHLITGPNSSGKSVYIKQVGLIVFLAHLGCWVPATKAIVPITDRIFTRIQTIESLSLGMSSFQCDINQISAALRNCTRHSLLLVDEFGKGTAPEDGEALLAAVMLELMERGGRECPNTLFSTHFHGVHSLLAPSSLLLATYTLHTELDTGGDLTYFYRLHSGEGTNSSEALKVAAKAGVEESVLQRARAVMEGDLQGDNVEIGKVHELMEQLMDLDLDSLEDVELFMEEVSSVFV